MKNCNANNRIALFNQKKAEEELRKIREKSEPKKKKKANGYMFSNFDKITTDQNGKMLRKRNFNVETYPCALIESSLKFKVDDNKLSSSK